MDHSIGERAWIWLNSAVGANARLADQLLFMNDGLLPFFETVRKGGSFRLPQNAKDSLKSALVKNSDDRVIDGVIKEAEKKGFSIVTRDSSDYPVLLREIYDPPTLLFVKGRLRGNIPLPVAVIGSRKCTDYGKKMAERFGKELAEQGACIISGMAAGCDSYAACGALSVKSSEYPTVAVLGSGVDVIYPSSNRRLYEEIAERGAVISENPIGQRPSRESFPRRNRIISGMSRGVLVVEAGERSGTSITVGCAHDQGREVFAIPGRLTDAMSRGSNGLIKQGAAKAVFGVDDILYEFGVFVVPEEEKKYVPEASGLNGVQRRILSELQLGEKTADELCEKLGLSASEIGASLTEMELSGIINKQSSGLYSL